MPHEILTDQLREDAALFALGMLDAHAAREFEKHLREGCPACAAEVASYGSVAGEIAAVAASAPPLDLRRRLLEQTVPVPPGIIGVRANEGNWFATPVPGVDCKILHQHPVTKEVTQLVRFRPGTRYPRHHHTADEQCLVLEGDVRMGKLVYRAGDFIVARAETDHDVLTTQEGCLLLLVASPHDQYIQ
jgi:anti-sigma factor ChrR (cupin superfamily)